MNAHERFHGQGQERARLSGERDFLIDKLLVRFHLIIVMIRWTGLAPREFEFSFPGSLTSTFLLTPAQPIWSLRTGGEPGLFPAQKNDRLVPQAQPVKSIVALAVNPSEAELGG